MIQKRWKNIAVFWGILIVLLCLQASVYAAPAFPVPKVDMNLGPAENPQDVAATLQIIFMKKLSIYLITKTKKDKAHKALPFLFIIMDFHVWL
jgi:hypothetical protein